MRRIVLAILAAAALSSPAAAGKWRCGADTWLEAGERRAYTGKYLVVCDANDRCKAVTYVKDQAQPMEWTHRMAFLKDGVDAPWQVEFSAASPPADAAEGFVFVVDNHNPIAVPPEVISSPGALTDHRLNADLTDPLLRDLKPGANVDWRYKAKDTKADASAVLSLYGLRRALRWVECTQKH